MSEERAAHDIDGDAAAWALRIDVHDDDADPDFQAWLTADRRHPGALLRAQAALDLVDRSAAVYGAAPEPAALRIRKPDRRTLIFAGGAGIAAAATAGLVGLWGLRAERFDTLKGEIRRVPLNDGSLIAINTESSVAVSMKRRLRQVDLRQGEAWFEVAKDPERPFVVAVGDIRVRAVGTAFSVQRRAGMADVMVTEGVVETWVAGRERDPVRVAAGSKILVDPAAASLPVTAQPEIERHLAWRNGEIMLDGQSLIEAAAEFNRYNQRQIVIDDAALGAVRFVGVFQLNDPESFAKAVSASVGARIVARDGAIRLKALS